MSKIRELIEEYTQNEPVSRVIEQAIKAEIMGLQRHYVSGIDANGPRYRGKSGYSKGNAEDIIMVSDLDNLFKESE